MSSSLTTEPIPVLTRRIAIPASVGFFFNTMYNFVDTYCAGLISTDALAALSLSFPVFFIILSAGSGLSQGTTALMANAIGAKKPEEARHLFAQALVFAAAAGVVLSFVGWIAAPSLFRLLGAEGDYLGVALAYMNVILCGGVFFILQMTINASLNAQATRSCIATSSSSAARPTAFSIPCSCGVGPVCRRWASRASRWRR